MGKPYAPPGYVGLVDAARLMAEWRYPGRWADEAVPSSETAIWRTLGLQRYPSLISSFLTIDLPPPRDAQMADRYCDFVEAQEELRGALVRGTVIASYIDDAGIFQKLGQELWASEAGGEVVREGTVWIWDDLGSVLRFVLIQINSFKSLAKDQVSASAPATAATSAELVRATTWLAEHLENLGDAKHQLRREQGFLLLAGKFSVGSWQYRETVWPNARERAGLERKARAGRPKSAG